MLSVVSILQYINIANHYVVRLKLMLYDNDISKKNFKS